MHNFSFYSFTKYPCTHFVVEISIFPLFKKPQGATLKAFFNIYFIYKRIKLKTTESCSRNQVYIIMNFPNEISDSPTSITLEIQGGTWYITLVQLKHDKVRKTRVLFLMTAQVNIVCIDRGDLSKILVLTWNISISFFNAVYI